MIPLRPRIAAALALCVLVSSCAAWSATGDVVKKAGQTIGNAAGATLGLATRWRGAGETGEHGPQDGGSTRIALNVEDPSLERLGGLTWRGGLRLDIDDKQFGGLSGLLVSDDGATFLAVSDKGFWVNGTLSYRGTELVGADQILVTPMLGLDGAALTGKKESDAESLIGTPDGQVLVSFEHLHRVWAYDLSKDGFRAVPREMAMPAGLKGLNANGGLEGIAFLKDRPGTLMALSENTLDDDGNMIGWLRQPGGNFPVSLKRIKPFSLTDLTTLPNGDVLTLERRYSPFGGSGYQIRRIDGADIQPGAVLDGPVVANAATPFQVDNMEGIDVRRNKNGDLIVYLVSDDNYNPLQRTLLLSFKLTN